MAPEKPTENHKGLSEIDAMGIFTVNIFAVRGSRVLPWRSSSAMKVQGISVGIAQASRGCRKAGFAKSGPQVERPPHRSRERPDFIRGAAHVRARTLLRCQQRIRSKSLICVDDRVPADSECACQRARGGKVRSRGQPLFENRLPELIV